MKPHVALVCTCIIMVYITTVNCSYVNGHDDTNWYRYGAKEKDSHSENTSENTEMRLGKFIIKLIGVCGYMEHMTDAKELKTLVEGQRSGNDSKQVATLKSVISAMANICMSMYGEILQGTGSLGGIPGLTGSGNDWLDKVIKHIDGKSVDY